MASQIALTDWVSEAKSKKDIQFREAVHIVLHAVGSDAQTAHTLVLKGGILLALKFNSERFTKDIDFTCISEYASFPDVMVQERLNKSLKTSAVILGYSLDCRVQKTELKPDLRKHPNPKFPGLQVNIGYGKKGSLRQGRTYADVLLIDISYNEFLSDDVDLFSDEISVKCYKLKELMAEKFRSILQQVPRNRARRQDVYDLNYLIKNHCKKTDQERSEILNLLLKKSVDKNIDDYLNPKALDLKEIRDRSNQEYLLLASEVASELPDFEESYQNVNTYFKSLPWAK